MISSSQRPLTHNTQHSQRQSSIELLWTTDQPIAQRPLPHNTQHSQRQSIIELLWRSDQPVTETSTSQHITPTKTVIHRTPLDDWSARRTDLYLTKNTQHSQRQLSIEVLWTSDQPVTETSTSQHTTLTKTVIHRTPLYEWSTRHRDL